MLHGGRTQAAMLRVVAPTIALCESLRLCGSASKPLIYSCGLFRFGGGNRFFDLFAQGARLVA